ncbi:MAG: NAD-dependent epimerase/dehydratase family protein [Lentimicrobium sp.]|uniref:NAD-dependent epimerase/dehydratase family protein n=1 Tax=Lentimicrobium sp. TaxID=2034841 RepID=UPI0025EF2477|nr:NAD-dependent epimerase/dehydratase family protein [Lentimicrobium sp.]MCO5256363.1 NAD-dependent epimerase/dehydratase family protein [Lentimicrobium sp.]
MIFVTGATGLVGSYLLYSLLQKDEPVRALLFNQNSLKRTQRIFESLGADAGALLAKVEWMEGDVLDIPALIKAMQGVDKVYHCAAVVSFDPRDHAQMMKINVEGTANVVNAALEAGVEKLCHVSSIAALGRTENSPVIDEKSQFKTGKYNSKYSLSKFLAEREVWRGTAEGLSAVIVNPSIILGYGHPEKGSTRMFTTIYRNSLFYGQGINGFVGVEDVVRAMIGLMESPVKNERFVVSAGDFSYKEVFSMIARGFGKPEPEWPVPSFLLELVWRFEWLRGKLTGTKPLITRETARTSKGNYQYASRKLQCTLKFEYTPLEDTITRTCRLIKNDLEMGKA